MRATQSTNIDQHGNHASEFKMDVARFAKMFLMIVGAVAIIVVAGQFSMTALSHGLCDSTLYESSITDDGQIKATAYETECGAAAATRIHVTLSNPSIDGMKHGDEIVTLRHDGGPVELRWTTNRDLVVNYPAGAEIEYAMAKTRGIRIFLNPQ